MGVREPPALEGLGSDLGAVERPGMRRRPKDWSSRRKRTTGVAARSQRQSGLAMRLSGNFPRPQTLLQTGCLLTAAIPRCPSAATAAPPDRSAPSCAEGNRCVLASRRPRVSFDAAKTVRLNLTHARQDEVAAVGVPQAFVFACEGLSNVRRRSHSRMQCYGIHRFIEGYLD